MAPSLYCTDLLLHVVEEFYTYNAMYNDVLYDCRHVKESTHIRSMPGSPSSGIHEDGGLKTPLTMSKSTAQKKSWKSSWTEF